MAIEGINNKEKMIKDLERKQQIGIPQVQVNPSQGQEGQGIDSNSWSAKYGPTATIHDVAAGRVSARNAGSQTVQTMGAQAGSSANPVTPNDNSGNQTFNLADAVQMDNLPVGGTNAVGGVQTTTTSAISQPTGPERGETDNAESGQSQGRRGSVGYGASHEALMTLLGSTTVKVSDGVPEPSPNGVEPKSDSDVKPEENGNANGSGNVDNKNDSSNGKVDNDQANPKNEYTAKADLKKTESEAQKKTEEEAARRRAEEQASA